MDTVIVAAALMLFALFSGGNIFAWAIAELYMDLFCACHMGIVSSLVPWNVKEDNGNGIDEHEYVNVHVTGIDHYIEDPHLNLYGYTQHWGEVRKRAMNDLEPIVGSDQNIITVNYIVKL